MTLKMIDEIYLYTSSQPEDAINTHEIVAWFDHSGIPYTNLLYFQHEEVLKAINTWWAEDDNGIIQEPVTGFPFVIYTEVHSDKPVSYLPRKYIYGKDNIIEQLPSLYALGR